MIDVYFFERSLCDYTFDWLKEIAKIDTFNIKGFFKSCNNKDVPEPTNPSIIISNCHSDYVQFLDKLHEKNLNFGVIQQSDETLADTFSFCYSDKCKFVARGYIHPHARYNERLFHYGLGYKKGFTVASNNRTFSKRELTWGFAGAVRATPGYPETDRVKAVSVFNHLQPNEVFNVDGFFGPNRYSAQEYRAFMDKCKFSLCPYGHVNSDTHRLYESLEAGCIPIVLRNTPFNFSLKIKPSYWHAVFRKVQDESVLPFLESIDIHHNTYSVAGEKEEVPFIMGDSWEECYEKVNKVIESNQGDLLQQQCKEFWSKWKQYWICTFEKNIKKLYS